MAKGKQTDSEIRAKIFEIKVNNPDLTAVDIAEMLGIPERTVSRFIKEELAKVGDKSQRAADLIDTNATLISLADTRLQELLENDEEKISARDLVSIRESAFKQNQLLTGKPTGNININSVKDLTTEELLEEVEK